MSFLKSLFKPTTLDTQEDQEIAVGEMGSDGGVCDTTFEDAEDSSSDERVDSPWKHITITSNNNDIQSDSDHLEKSDDDAEILSNKAFLDMESSFKDVSITKTADENVEKSSYLGSDGDFLRIAKIVHLKMNDSSFNPECLMKTLSEEASLLGDALQRGRKQFDDMHCKYDDESLGFRNKLEKLKSIIDKFTIQCFSGAQSDKTVTKDVVAQVAIEDIEQNIYTRFFKSINTIVKIPNEEMASCELCRSTMPWDAFIICKHVFSTHHRNRMTETGYSIDSFRSPSASSNGTLTDEEESRDLCVVQQSGRYPCLMCEDIFSTAEGVENHVKMSYLHNIKPTDELKILGILTIYNCIGITYASSDTYQCLLCDVTTMKGLHTLRSHAGGKKHSTKLKYLEVVSLSLHAQHEYVMRYGSERLLELVKLAENKAVKENSALMPVSNNVPDTSVSESDLGVVRLPDGRYECLMCQFVQIDAASMRHHVKTTQTHVMHNDKLNRIGILTLTNCVGVVSLRDKPIYGCKLCDVEGMTSKVCLEQHLLGRFHVERFNILKTLDLEIEIQHELLKMHGSTILNRFPNHIETLVTFNVQKEVPKIKRVRIVESHDQEGAFYCVQCRVEIVDDSEIFPHLEDEDHEYFSIDKIEGSLDEHIHHCRKCDVTINGQKNVIEHLLGSRHTSD